MMNTNEFDVIMRDFNKYRYNNAVVEQRHIGPFIILECNDYLIRQMGHCRYTIFDSQHRLVASIPNNVNVSVMYCDPHRLVLAYQEYKNATIANQFWFNPNVLCGYLEEDLFQERLKGLVNSNKQCKIYMYKLHVSQWAHSAKWLLTKYN